MCSLERFGSVLVLRLTGETEHRFSPALCLQIRQHLATAATSDARALVTTNDGKYFSNGLDLEWTKPEPETRVPFVLRELERVVLDLLRLNMPTYAAICGHAAAGGLLFAMAHDHRIMRKDRGFLYSAAVDINFVLPPGSSALMRSKMTPKVFKDMVLKGVKYTGIMANEVGLIDSLQEDSDATFNEAMNQAESFAARSWNKAAYAGLRLSMYPELVERLEKESNAGGFLHL
ncbi:hypothetical protein KP509_33G012300 [Ceratopteris richardii]|uniref:Delta(3)-Delta(2)-enoyl-CoA isomerase n=1 Tax=Ceratopteris richardii TaxID=49495 RepID=A0A8T2QNY2_CERRI|nr:hypothetical protein KP509_33G012300 [Ceratopteris richardii]KAH7285093.1 hypothetical protein KP509_33G012300 [Ceratopteris richardii]